METIPDEIRRFATVLQNSPLNEVVGSGDVEAIAQLTLSSVLENTDLSEGDNVLDFGCGIGRSTLPLALYAKSGTVFGIDIVKSMVSFCNREIASRLHNAHFLHLLASNVLYDHLNDDAYRPATENVISIDANDMTDRFSGYFNIITAFSVFTHFTIEQAKDQLCIFNTLLKSGGVVLLSMFFDTPWNRFRLDTTDDGYRDCYLDEPLKYVLFDFGRFAELASSAGFRICRVNFGFRDVPIPIRLRKYYHPNDLVVLSKMPTMPKDFDAGLYLMANPDLAAVPDLADHYLKCGFCEERLTRPVGTEIAPRGQTKLGDG